MDREEDLSKFYEEELPKWEAYIYSLAYNMINKYRKVIDPSVGIDDICQELRMGLWRAIQKYNEERGAKLSSYIHLILKREGILFVQKQYRDHPKDTKGNFFTTYSMYSPEDKEVEETIKELEDRDALTRMWDGIDDQKELKEEITLIGKIMLPRKSFHEKTIFNMILSRRYDADAEIAKELNINFAKVGEVRLILKTALCLLHSWDITEFSNDTNLERIVKRTRARLLHYIGEGKLSPTEKVLPVEKWQKILEAAEQKKMLRLSQQPVEDLIQNQ